MVTKLNTELLPFLYSILFVKGDHFVRDWMLLTFTQLNNANSPQMLYSLQFLSFFSI